MVLQSIVSQQLLLSEKNGQAPVFEILMANSAIKTMIRDAKVHQMDSIIYSSVKDGMKSMDASILEAYQEDLIDEHAAMLNCMNKEMMKRNVMKG